ncbi:MAG: HupE/UreJ family protein [Pseudomonadales bacterium]
MSRPVTRGVLFLLSLLSWPLWAHEIPADVQIRMYLKPEAQTLTVLMRVPLEAMRDFEFARRGPGYLDLPALEPQLIDAVRLWLLDDLKFYESGRLLDVPRIAAVRVALPSDSAFDDYATALTAVRSERLDPGVDLPWAQALLDVELSYVIESADAEFELEPTLARLGLRTLVQVRLIRDPVETDSRDEVGVGATSRGLSFVGDPGRISLEPGWSDVFSRFLTSGFEHVLEGVDHLLFVFALVIPLLRWRALVAVVTAFTLAHSLTLGASMLGLVPTALWFPALVESLIAFSIVLMALSNLFELRSHGRWLIAFVFGLVHGFGFSFALSEMLAFAGDHLSVSLLAFNLGVEAGQLLVLAILVPLLLICRRLLPGRVLVIVLSAVVAHSGWHWFTERWTTLSSYSFIWPEWDRALLAGSMRWLMLVLTATLVIWVCRGLFERWVREPGNRRV